MCVSAVVLHDDKEASRVSNLGELARALAVPLDEIPLCENLDVEPEPTFCLCILDAERLGRMLGCVVTPPSWEAEDRFGDCMKFRRADHGASATPPVTDHTP